MCIQSLLVQFSTSWSLVKEILCVFLGYVHVRVYDLVFMCSFRPCPAWHRALT